MLKIQLLNPATTIIIEFGCSAFFWDLLKTLITTSPDIILAFAVLLRAAKQKTTSRKTRDDNLKTREKS